MDVRERPSRDFVCIEQEKETWRSQPGIRTANSDSFSGLFATLAKPGKGFEN
jgi:hypothetical protein